MERARLFNAILLPLVLGVGLVANSLCLAIFSSRRMHRTSNTSSCSWCLGALSLSDLLVLFTYGLVEWLKRGFALEVVTSVGSCKIYVYLTYVLRMNSVGLLVLFTAQRFIGVCLPLHQTRLCTRRNTRRAIVAVFLVASAFCIYKPLTSEFDGRTCGSPKDLTPLAQVVYALDTCYGLLLTGVPFLVILCLNLCIARVLLMRRHELHRWTHQHHQKHHHKVIKEDAESQVRTNTVRQTPEAPHEVSVTSVSGCSTNGNGCMTTGAVPSSPRSFPTTPTASSSTKVGHHSKAPSKGAAASRTMDGVGLQFCMTLLAISTCFIVLNSPYFLMFLTELVHESQVRLTVRTGSHRFCAPGSSATLLVTRGIFMLNYAVNFFLYSLTGKLFRTEIGRLLCCLEDKAAVRKQQLMQQQQQSRWQPHSLALNSPVVNGKKHGKVPQVHLPLVTVSEVDMHHVAIDNRRRSSVEMSLLRNPPSYQQSVGVSPTSVPWPSPHSNHQEAGEETPFLRDLGDTEI